MGKNTDNDTTQPREELPEVAAGAPGSAELMAEAFIRWPLPESVCPDACVLDRTYPNRCGTHLLTVVEARQMFEYCLANIPITHAGRNETELLRNAVKNMILSLGAGNVEQAVWTGEAILAVTSPNKKVSNE